MPIALHLKLSQTGVKHWEGYTLSEWYSNVPIISYTYHKMHFEGLMIKSVLDHSQTASPAALKFEKTLCKYKSKKNFSFRFKIKIALIKQF